MHTQGGILGSKYDVMHQIDIRLRQCQYSTAIIMVSTWLKLKYILTVRINIFCLPKKPCSMFQDMITGGIHPT